jgi:hypothetical protein
VPAVQQPAQRHWHERAPVPVRETVRERPQIARRMGDRRPLY